MIPQAPVEHCCSLRCFLFMAELVISPIALRLRRPSAVQAKDQLSAPCVLLNPVKTRRSLGFRQDLISTPSLRPQPTNLCKGFSVDPAGGSPHHARQPWLNRPGCSPVAECLIRSITLIKKPKSLDLRYLSIFISF